MRKDQREKLAGLSERLADFAIDAADPENWGLTTYVPKDMTDDDKLFSAGTVRLASQAVGLLIRVEQVVALRNPLFDDVDEPKVDNDIAAAERKAEALLKRVMSRNGKAKA